MSTARQIYGTKWSEKEYLIVLNAYFEHQNEPQHADTQFIAEISKLLGRTPHSILYRLQNFASVDPNETDPHRKGKINITEFGRNLFLKWHSQRDNLKEVAEAFVRDERFQFEPTFFDTEQTRLPTAFLGKYEPLDEIGRGGYGVVFSCLNVENEQIYALKVIDGARARDGESIFRFKREIRALKAIDHPNVMHIYEDNLEDEQAYPGFVMDLAECDLAQFMARKNDSANRRPVLDHSEASAIYSSILQAVQSLHQADTPIIHRDINPNNILKLFDGRWVLADFSLAKFLPVMPVSTTFCTGSRVQLGTTYYASPEQYRDMKDTDARSDVYSLGMLLWELFSNEWPPCRREKSGLPTEYETLFQHTTSYDRNERPSNVVEVFERFRNASMRRSMVS